MTKINIEEKSMKKGRWMRPYLRFGGANTYKIE